LLFIDEADAFLGVRHKDMSEGLRNALTTMLYHTGTASSQFLLVLATNRPGDLDPAVLDRVDESVEFGLPQVSEREKLVKQYYNMFVGMPLKMSLSPPKPKKNAFSEADISGVAHSLEGFSGREISKLFIGLQTHICARLLGGGGAATKLLKNTVKKGLKKTKTGEEDDGEVVLTRSFVNEVIDSKLLEHKRTHDVIEKGYTYVHREGGGKKRGTMSTDATSSPGADTGTSVSPPSQTSHSSHRDSHMKPSPSPVPGPPGSPLNSMVKEEQKQFPQHISPVPPPHPTPEKGTIIKGKLETAVKTDESQVAGASAAGPLCFSIGTPSAPSPVETDAVNVAPPTKASQKKKKSMN